MPIAGRTIYKVNSWATPGFDIKDPVFYAPLWRPDMVARGGSIINGNGTMDVSPRALAVGANTITVTAAGTLIVSMPEGGTVASGTMTVTGSTVTVSAGIATTITTTGATGNITVTPSNIYRSKDKNNFALTNTGALWTPQGRTFGPVLDDFISINSVLTPLASTTSGLWSLWVKMPDVTPDTVMALTSFGDTNADEFIVVFIWTDGTIKAYCYDAGAAQWVLTTDACVISDNTWFNLMLIQDGISPILVVNNAQPAQTFSDSTDKTKWFSALTGLDNGRIGCKNYGSSGDTLLFSGVVGEASMYSRSPSASERTNLFLSTKWRYQ